MNGDRIWHHFGTTADGVRYAVAVLADGMGGLEGGVQAAELAVRRMSSWVEKRLPLVLGHRGSWCSLQRELHERIELVHRELRELRAKDGRRYGTTLTVLLLVDSVYWVFHVGDCRVYRLAPNGVMPLRRLTYDHTWVDRQARLGLMSADTARRHPRRHVLLRYLGMSRRLVIDMYCGAYKPGTLFMLSSDGFHSCFSDGQLERMLRIAAAKGCTVQASSEELVKRALEAGSSDNISVMLLRPGGRGPSSWTRLGLSLMLLPYQIRHARWLAYFR